MSAEGPRPAPEGTPSPYPATLPEPKRYERGSEEFGRVLSFTDGVVAIALTLLVLTIEVPHPAPGTEATANVFAMVGDLGEQLWAFFLSFVIIGFYWANHHRFMASLTAITRAMVAWTLAFLLSVVLMPLQAQIIGLYPDNEQAVVIYAAGFVVFGIIGAAGYLTARHQGLLVVAHSPAAARAHLLDISVAPLVFVASMPVAVFLDAGMAMLMWLLIWPLSWWSSRYLRRHPA